MTAVLQDPLSPAPLVAPPISVTRDGRRWPMDYGGAMDDAWHAAWQILADHGWHDAAPMAAWVARQAGIEIDSARGMLRQAVRRGVLSVRRRLRGEPRRWRAEYKVRSRTADSYERAAAALIERFLRSTGRRAGFNPQADVPAFHGWLANIGEDKKWRRCRDGVGVDTDVDLLAAIRRIRPRLIDPRGAQRSTPGRRPSPRDSDAGQVKAQVSESTLPADLREASEVGAAQTSPEVLATAGGDPLTETPRGFRVRLLEGRFLPGDQRGGACSRRRSGQAHTGGAGRREAARPGPDLRRGQARLGGHLGLASPLGIRRRIFGQRLERARDRARQGIGRAAGRLAPGDPRCYSPWRPVMSAPAAPRWHCPDCGDLLPGRPRLKQDARCRPCRRRLQPRRRRPAPAARQQAADLDTNSWGWT
jgi:hypothetical protein